MSRRARVLLVSIVTTGVLAATGIAGYFAWQDHLYVRSDDATVAGNIVFLYPGGTGTLTAWNAAMGKHVSAGTVLGTVHPDPNPAQVLPDVKIAAPIDGTIVQSSAVVGQHVVAGSTALGALVDPSSLWIVAYVDEGSIHRLQVGQRADVHVDALPDNSFSGSVAVIGQATQSSLSALPASNVSGSFTKVAQRVPVRIDLDARSPVGLPVGGNAEVTIHVG